MIVFALVKCKEPEITSRPRICLFEIRMGKDSIQISSSQIKSRQEVENHINMIRDMPRFYALALLYEKPRFGYEIICSVRRELG